MIIRKLPGLLTGLLITLAAGAAYSGGSVTVFAELQDFDSASGDLWA